MKITISIAHLFLYRLATANNCMPYYSQPFGGYIFPGCIFKRKGGQVRFTPQQSQNLEQQFNSHKYLSPVDRKKLALQLKLSDRQVCHRRFYGRVGWEGGPDRVPIVMYLFDIISGEDLVSKSSSQMATCKVDKLWNEFDAHRNGAKRTKNRLLHFFNWWKASTTSMRPTSW